MEQKRVEIVTIETNIPNAIILDGKLLRESMERRESHHKNWRIHIFFIGTIVGFIFTKLI